MVVWERLESLDDWLGSISWFFLSKMTKSSESPMSSKLIEHKSPGHSALLSLSDKLLLGTFVPRESYWACRPLALKSFPWKVLGGRGGGASTKQVGGLRSLLFGAFCTSVSGWVAEECLREPFDGDSDVTCKFSTFSSFGSNKSTKQSARLDARSLRIKSDSRRRRESTSKGIRPTFPTFSSNPYQNIQNVLHPQFAALPGPSLWQWFSAKSDLKGDGRQERRKIYYLFCARKELDSVADKWEGIIHGGRRWWEKLCSFEAYRTLRTCTMHCHGHDGCDEEIIGNFSCKSGFSR